MAKKINQEIEKQAQDFIGDPMDSDDKESESRIADAAKMLRELSALISKTQIYIDHGHGALLQKRLLAIVEQIESAL